MKASSNRRENRRCEAIAKTALRLALRASTATKNVMVTPACQDGQAPLSKWEAREYIARSMDYGMWEAGIATTSGSKEMWLKGGLLNG